MYENINQGRGIMTAGRVKDIKFTRKSLKLLLKKITRRQIKIKIDPVANNFADIAKPNKAPEYKSHFLLFISYAFIKAQNLIISKKVLDKSEYEAIDSQPTTKLL